MRADPAHDSGIRPGNRKRIKNTHFLRVLLVTDGKGDCARLEKIVRQAVKGGVRAVQFREKNLDDQQALRVLRQLRKLIPKGKGLLLVNDRLDLCMASDADGVQLGYRSVSVQEARSFLGNKTWIGVSVHHKKELSALKNSEADFAVLGPVFPTPSKKAWLNSLGEKRLEEWVALSPIPVIAIGGINSRNATKLAQTGVSGIAGIRSVFHSPKPKNAARNLVSAALFTHRKKFQ